MPKPIETLITSLHPGAKLVQVVVGDLNNDGSQDAAYVASWSDPIELEIGVLRGGPNGTFVEWTHTKRFEMGQRPPEVEIRSNSLYVSSMTIGLSWGNWDTIQYSLRAGRLVRVGADGLYRSPRLDFEPGPVHTKRQSTNYLTCRETMTETEGKKREVVKSKVIDCKLEALEDFSYRGIRSEF